MAAKIRFANRHFHLPQSKPIRIGLGILLVAFGLVGFLPVVGFWMIPLGLLVLSVDVPIVRRWRRQLAVWWHRDRKENGEGAPNGTALRRKIPRGRRSSDVAIERWRPRPESNRGARICSPLRHHSATWPG